MFRRWLKQQRGGTGIAEVKTEKNLGFSDISLELIDASGEVGIQMMAELCQRVLDDFGMSAALALSMVALIFKGRVISGYAVVMEL